MGTTGEPVLLQILNLPIIKEILPPKIKQQHFFDSLRRVCSLHHYNIVPLNKFWPEDDTIVLCYQHCSGSPLSTTITDGKFSIAEVFRITIEICSALDRAHQLGIVHGHLSPDDILIQDNGRVQVFQFGFRVLIQKMAKLNQIPENELPYFCPDLFRSEPIKSSDDVFSAGIIFHQLLTGNNPFEGKNESEIIQNICQNKPPPLPLLENAWFSELEPIMAKVLAKEEKDRFENCGLFIAALKSLRSKRIIADISDAPEPDLIPTVHSENEKTTIISPAPSRSFEIENQAITPSILKPAPSRKDSEEYEIETDSLGVVERSEPIKTKWLSFGVV
ncbi:serine/threonine protein kinase, partial [candidate division CSSED10-310 bacterium]